MESPQNIRTYVPATYPSPLGDHLEESPSLSDDEQALISWAQGRFAQAGLTLPPVNIRFDPTRKLCGNSEGLYQFDGHEHHVTICIRSSDSFAAQHERRRTLLHEFGHMWDTANLDADQREHLTDLFGLHAWNDSNDEWADRGIENLAETFVFGLLDQPARQLKVEGSCEVFAAVFAEVTGTDPLGPGEPPCVGQQPADTTSPTTDSHHHDNNLSGPYN